MSILTQLQQFSINMLGPFGPLIALGGAGLLLIMLALVLMIQMRSDPIEKLGRDGASKKNSSSKTDQLRRSNGSEKLAKYSALLEPQDEKQLSEARKMLIQAGYHSRDAVRAYNLAQVGLGLLGLILGVGYYLLFMAGNDETTTKQMLMYTLGPGVVGYMAPKYWVTRRVATRQEEITAGFPDALDMLLVCVEAGQSLDQAIVRVAAELHASFPALADELEIVAYEMKAGKDKSTVLNDMADRCGVHDISSFVTVLIQSAAFGTSIAEALRVYAGEMRDKRVMRAEEAANKLPTKMTLATMMLTVPPLLIILVGPSVVGITKLGATAGGN